MIDAERDIPAECQEARSDNSIVMSEEKGIPAERQRVT